MIPNDANTYLPGTIQIPSSMNITAITNSYPMVVTAEVNSLTESNSYIVGQVVRLTVPRSYGMFQANNLQGQIVEIDGLDFSLNIDSRQFDVFAVPEGNVQQPASLAPSGSRNLQFNNSTNSVPFQSLNNIGN
jgi:hypothetical protein